MSHKLILIFAFCAFLVILALGSALPMARAQGLGAAPDACPTPIKKTWQIKGNCGTNPLKNFVGTTDNQSLVFRTNKIERMRLDAAGNVGIGTTSPGSKLTVVGLIQSTSGGFKFPDGSTQITAVASGNFVKKNGDTMTGALNLPANGLKVGPNQLVVTGGKVGIGTTTPAHHVSIIGGPLWTLNSWSGALELSNAAAIGWQANNGGKRFGLGQSNGGLYFFRTTSDPGTTASLATYDVLINDVGNVGIGTTDPGATLEVKGPSNTTTNGVVFKVTDSNGVADLQVSDNGYVKVGALNGFSTTHACFDTLYFAACSSAAEYVPSIDGGSGFPETADLVSIAPSISNPYGDTHGPFTVQKSATACDSNLLGFIVKPESGADGVKLNDHYLPLAIYGYFPAKVSMESGYIHRGDPLTSSSKPGYAMKATGACKIIGYALEDATVEGTIQVFANHGENTAPQVASLQAQVNGLTQENRALKETLTNMDARLKALEIVSPVSYHTNP